MGSESNNSRRALAVAATLAVVAGMAGAYFAGIFGADDSPDPSAEDLVTRQWGSDLAPDEADLAYGPATGCAAGESDHTCGGSQELDIYRMLDGESRGTIVYFHGGGFMTGDKAPLSGLGNIMRQLDRGFGIVSANYRLTDNEANENGFPDTMADVAAALSWVQENGEEHGLNTDVLIVAGASAGGTLSGLAGTTANSSDPVFDAMPEVDGWMAISGIMSWEGGEMSEGWMQAWLGDAYIDQRDVASVTGQLDFNDPPGYIAHGGDDGFVETDNAELLADEVSVLAELLVWRFRGTLTVDIVDDFSGGEPMDENTGHQPLGGANATVMDNWIDEVVDGGPLAF